jgi:hypothetical protein
MGLRSLIKQRRGGRVQEREVGYSELLELVAAGMPPLVGELRLRDERRARHLAHLMTTYREILEALSALREAFLWLTRVPGVDLEIKQLMAQAAARTVTGVEAILAEAHPRTLDDARYMMELEFLLRDVAREPRQLARWRDAQPHQRNQQFGFGKLRQRLEAAQQVPSGFVLPDRDEYRSHSEAVHPSPVGTQGLDEVDEESGIFWDAGDLLQHAARLWPAALDAAAVTLTEDGANEFDEDVPDLAAVDVAMSRTDKTMRLLGINNDREPYVANQRTMEDVARSLRLDVPPHTDGAAD